MAYNIPPANHPARAMFDMAHIVEVLAPANASRLLDLDAAISSARKTIASGDFNGIVSVCIDAATDDRLLIHVGARGGWKKIWNFGHTD